MRSGKCRVPGAGYRVPGTGYWVPGAGCRGSRFPSWEGLGVGKFMAQALLAEALAKARLRAQGSGRNGSRFPSREGLGVGKITFREP